ncbi:MULTISPECIES: type I-E CRISPR-associated protein Cas6/Cse3/CasE [unclassified Streptomyces]|uniref:type I-E CRISPR-associated protein Cas6/Cse3/CasE n=1 Tax=unclassified Streptomyces TaxID=2593676 RepID=UPI002DDB712D|nr:MULTISPECIES: type I-E CRISPR-associated protein Cas6/Cse3/CasE [unclassified Streptomyces]WSA97608.1 type I-E CRISPR-associated protein Cas6/Cse3/CasE [Streptomyces sp. NBC_01795]WSB82142.1 type I-E CRISPR-associated protein Cas6/Cse3/CasE [Streptomyces sp. NBC_01775]WSS18113.1 type I-E CRISPR-associated protein Cas6/Cse3/CasE [Streptomyces sp. NBC_01186]WSS46883.1 type I-E CRISPR-associated protein Cas6/Cse3/CasE [Streptomyces sp. NBC_01187]
MYLTRFRLNTARAGARRLLSSPQMLHAGVMSSFAQLLPPPGEAAKSGPRVLWRVDRSAKAAVHLHIVSHTKPDLTHLVEQAGWPTTPDGWQSYEYAPFLSRLKAGDTWAFRLTANPVHHIRRKNGEPIKRTAHITPRHQIGWLLKRQQAAGFEVLEKPAAQRLLPESDEWQIMVHDRRNLNFGKTGEQPRGSQSRNRVSLVTATFDGRLRITDPEALRHALTAGIGKAKAYGCGLMTLSPAE